MADIGTVWGRVRRHAGDEFRTIRGLPFTYEVPDNYMRITRQGQNINRSLSRMNFARALDQMPASGPGELSDRQGSPYTWAILMDAQIRGRDW